MNGEGTIAAAIQMVSCGGIEQNFKDALSHLNYAVMERGANLLVYPENFLCFGKSEQSNLAKNLPYYLEKFQRIAADLSVTLVLGSMPTYTREDGSQTDGRFRSASFVINKLGDICAQYDKIHLFDVDINDAQGCYRESDDFEPGGAIKVVEASGCYLGLSICYDLRFPSLFQELRLAGANVIVVPAAFTKVTGKAHWEVLLRARAIETQSYVVAANQGGQHDDQRETWGHSMIVNPWGEIIAKHEVGKGVCSAKLDFDQLLDIRASIPVNQYY